ncbi:MAG: diguanylate cyclase [Deltaproteobacteria bacterium]|nr:diguanylate cyclase [Deltaproteobacteria bacterium]
MIDNKKVKFHLVVFAVFMSGFIAALIFLFNKNRAHFDTELYSHSRNNIKVIDELSAVGTHFYIHKRSLMRYLNTGEEKYFQYLSDSRTEIEKLFSSLEDFNDNYFQLWVRVTEEGKSREIKYFTSNEKEELKKQIDEFQKGELNEKYFQRLFYLVRYNLSQYFKSSAEIVGQKMNDPFYAPQADPAFNEGIDKYFNLIYSGINQIITVYNELFWEHTLSQNSQYHKNTTYYFRTLIAVSVVLLLYTFVVFAQVMHYFRRQRILEQREELAMLKSQDVTTGLLNRESFDVFTRMELARARRQAYHICMVFVEIEELDWIEKALGHEQTNRVLSQLAFIFDSNTRTYDRVYRFRRDVFAIVMPETNRGHINNIIMRFKTKISKDPLLDKLRLMSNLAKISFVSYPEDGITLEELVQRAEKEFLPVAVTPTNKNESGQMDAQELKLIIGPTPAGIADVTSGGPSTMH